MRVARLGGVWLIVSERCVSGFRRPEQLLSPSCSSSSSHAIPAGIEPCSVSLLREHRAGRALGGGTAIIAAVAGLPVSKATPMTGLFGSKFALSGATV